MRSSALLALGVFAVTAAAAAQNQVALPAHAATYNGFTRGYTFTAATAFDIVALELPADAYQVGDTAGFLVRVNGNIALWSIGNACSLIPTSIPIAIGDVVDVMGNWSPVVTNDFTAHNSYGSGSFATTIEGVPHTLMRSGWQWDIGAPNWVPTGNTGAFLAPTSGQLGRVQMYTSTTPLTVTPATCVRTGKGCVRETTSFYEQFGSSAGFDLANSALTMIPNAGGYLVVSGGSWIPVGSIGTSTALTLADNAEVNVPFTVGSFPGWTGLQICSNGFVSQAAGNGTSSAPAETTMLAAPQTSFRSWHNFNPAAVGSGPVRVEESAAVTTVTWDGVYSAGTTAASFVQFQFYATGTVTIAWGAMSGAGNGHLVGYSPGGPSADPGATDLSALGSSSLVLGTTDVQPLGLAASNRPLINSTWSLSTLVVPPTAVLGVDVFGLADPGIDDLGFLGAPGCGLRATLDLLSAWVPAGATHTFTLPIPNTAALAGMHVFTTSAVFQSPAVNAFGAITANGIDATIGNF